MLDLNLFRPEVDDITKNKVKERLCSRGLEESLYGVVSEILKTRNELIQKTEELKAQRNHASKEIGLLKAQAKKNPQAEAQAQEKMKAVRQMGDELKGLEEELAASEKILSQQLEIIPNLPDESVPVGKDEKANKEIRQWGKIPSFSFKPKDHVDLAESLGIIDFKRGAKLSGARFSILLGAGAALERALGQFMLDLHTREHGYEEVFPPFLVKADALYGTGQLPKFEEDLFKTQTSEHELYLIPTAEVPLTNLYAQEILENEKLPIYLAGHTGCFRSEAGSYGKDTRGLIRQHQFEKVELVKFSHPEDSFKELEKMIKDASRVLELLGLPYRVMLLSSGDMGFSSAKTYDLEVWLPAQSQYREISSCSNCTDFQARRAKIRFRRETKEKPEFVHTLNGSGLAIGRTWLAILENFQNEKGEICVPKVLHPYLVGRNGFQMRGDELWLTG